MDYFATRLGDVLILRTQKSFSVYAVGPVIKDGQQDFHSQPNVKYMSDHAAAVAEAKALLRPGRRMYLRNIDTGEWVEISK